MLGFLIAAAAGFLTPQLETPVAQPLAKMLQQHMTVAPNEIRLLAFMVALVAAAVLSMLFESGTTFGVIAGAILGYFGQRIYLILRKLIEGRTDAD